MTKQMNRTLTIKNVFGIVILSIFTALAVGATIAVAGIPSFPEANTQLYNFIALLIGQIFMVIPLFLFLLARRESFVDRLRLRRISFRTVLYTIIFSIGVIILVDEFDRLSGMILPPPDYFDQIGDMLRFNSLNITILLLFGVAFLAPLGEEILFRGFLQKFLEGHWQDITRAVLMTSLFFAVIHLNLYWLIQIYILGVLLGFLAWKTGSIWAGFILHSLNNLTALLFTNFDERIAGIYSWHGHVAPWMLLLGGLCAYYGFKTVNQVVEVQS